MTLRCWILLSVLACVAVVVRADCDDTPPTFHGFNLTGLPMLLNASGPSAPLVPFELQYAASHHGGALLSKIVFTFQINREVPRSALPQKIVEVIKPQPINANVSNTTFLLSDKFYSNDVGGTWLLVNVYMEDGVGNSINYPFNTPFFTLVGTSIHYRPNITSANLLPSSINVADGPKTVAFSFLGYTDVAPFHALRALYSCEGRNQSDILLTYASDANAPGVYSVQSSVTFQTGTWPCHYAFRYATVMDVSAFSAQSPLNLNASQAQNIPNFPMTFIIDGPQDTEMPVLDSFAFSSVRVTTTDSDQMVNFTIQASDNIGIEDITVYPKDANQKPLTLTADQRISGTALQGTYRMNLSFPAHYPTEIYQIARIVVRDFAHNTLNHPIANRDVNTATLYVDCCCTQENDRGASYLYEASIVVALLAIFLVGVTLALKYRHKCDPSMRVAPPASAPLRPYATQPLPDASHDMRQGLLSAEH